jgi:hypothetical protein
MAGRSDPGRIAAFVPYFDLWFLVLHHYFIPSKKLTGHTGLENVACLHLCWLHSYGILIIKLNYIYLVKIFLCSDHCVYPQNQTPDTMATQRSAIYRRERNDESEIETIHHEHKGSAIKQKRRERHKQTE